MTTAAKDLMAVGSLDWVRNKAQEQLLPEFPAAFVWIRTVYPDRLVAEVDEMGSMKLYEYGWTLAGSELTLGSPEEVAIEYAEKGRAELTGPIVKADGAKRVVYAPVLVPDEPDSDGDVVTAHKIEEVAHLWLEKYQNVDLGHSLNNVAMPVESYITPADIEFPGGTVPKGSWMLAARVPKEIWPDVVKGDWGGFSLMAVEANDAASVVKAASGDAPTGIAAKRTTLADLGDDWVVPFVSIVDRPAVPKAKWVAMKAEAPDPTPEGLFSQFRQWLTGETPAPAEKAGRKFSDATYNQLKAATEALSALLDEAENERSKSSEKGTDEMTPEELQTAIAGAISPLVERITAIEAAGANPASEAPATEDPVEDTTAEDVEALKAALAEQTAELEELKSFKSDVEKRFQAAPKSLAGQDGADEAPVSTPSNGEYTDAFGVRYRRDAMGRARPVLS